MTPSSALEFWGARHQTAPADWAESYWNSSARPYRTALIGAMRALGGGRSLSSALELGCNAGPNLRRVHEAWPNARLFGCDVNGHALAALRGYAQDEGWASCLTLMEGAIETQLASVTAGLSVDVVFSCYALAYVSPHEIARVIEQAVRLARWGVVFLEPLGDLVAPDWRYPPPTPEWAHGYASLLAPYVGPGRSLTITRLVTPADGLNGLVSLEVAHGD